MFLAPCLGWERFGKEKKIDRWAVCFLQDFLLFLVPRRTPRSSQSQRRWANTAKHVHNTGATFEIHVSANGTTFPLQNIILVEVDAWKWKRETGFENIATDCVIWPRLLFSSEFSVCMHWGGGSTVVYLVFYVWAPAFVCRAMRKPLSIIASDGVRFPPSDRVATDKEAETRQNFKFGAYFKTSVYRKNILNQPAFQPQISNDGFR